MDAMGSMRDLDQIQERDDAGRSSKMMSIAMGALATACVLFGVGVVVGREQGDSRPIAREDPLARLDQLAQASERPATTYAERLGNAPAAAAVGAAQPSTPTAVRPGAAGPAGAPLAAAVIGNPGAGIAGNAAPSLGDPNARPVLLPPANAPSAQGGLLRVRESGEGLISPASGTPAAAGTEGAFSVQVSAFQNETHAAGFAQQLRTRGYRAFVARPASGPGGVLWHRVRVGPFSSMREASQFRADFERRERMPTLVIRRDPPNGAPAAQ